VAGTRDIGRGEDGRGEERRGEERRGDWLQGLWKMVDATTCRCSNGIDPADDHKHFSRTAKLQLLLTPP